MISLDTKTNVPGPKTKDPGAKERVSQTPRNRNWKVGEGRTSETERDRREGEGGEERARAEDRDLSLIHI